MTNNYKFNKLLHLKVARFLLVILILIGFDATRVEAQVASYNFTSTSGTYTPIAGGTVVGAIGSSWDDGALAAQPIGFSFTYNGTAYTTFGISCNGYIFMGSGANTNTYCGPQGALNNLIAAWAHDFIPVSTLSGEVRYQTIGIAPNRQLVCQWSNVKHFSGPSGDDYTVQLILNESGTIQIVFGSFATVTTTGANTCADTNGESGSCGLKGASSSDFNIRTITNGTHTWTTSILGTAINAVCNVSPTNLPTSGLTYTWAQAACVTPANQPTSLSLVPFSTTQINGSFTAAAGSPLASGYLVVRYAAGATPSATPVDNTNYTAGAALGNGIVAAFTSSTSFSATGLTAGTSYDFYVYSMDNLCLGGTKYNTTSPLFGNASSNVPAVPNCAVTYTPVSGATEVSTTQVLSWTGAFGDPAITGYDVYVSTNSALVTASDPSVRVSTNQVGTTYTTITPYSLASTYYWKVVPKNSLGDAVGCVTNSFSTHTPITITSSTYGGNWNDTATWAGNIVPVATDSVIIADGATVIVNVAATVSKITVGQGTSGILAWGSTTFALTVLGDFNVSAGAQLNAFTTGLGAVTLNIGGNLNNGGVSALATTSLVMNGTSPQSINLVGGGSILGNIVRNISAANPTSLTINTPITIGFSFNPLLGTVNTNGNITINNTAQLFGQLYNQQVYEVIVNAKGSGYLIPPTVTINPPLNGTDTAKAVANIDVATGTVRSITITNPGSGYTVSPTMTISGGGGTGAAAIPVVITSIGGQTASAVQKNGNTTISGGLTINNSQGVGNVFVTNGGVGYTSAPTVGFSLPTGNRFTTATGSGYSAAVTVTFTGGGGSGATATAVVANGKVISINITSGGTNYTSAPTINFVGGGAGTGAVAPTLNIPTATASITNGMISGFTVINPGSGYIAAPTVTLTGGGFTTAAAGAASRIGLYNVTYGFFAPATVAAAGVEGAEIPSNRKINALTINNAAQGVTISGNLELTAAATALTLTSGVINMGANEIYASNPGYAGILSSTNVSFVNGNVRLSSPGGAATRSFPVGRGVTVTTGGGSVATGSDITNLTASLGAAPSGSVTPVTNTVAGIRTYRIRSNGGVYGNAATLPTAQIFWGPEDLLLSDNPSLFVAQATSPSGSWTVRSLTSGTGALPATGSRTTATGAPGPLVLTGDDYYTFTTTFVAPPALNYAIARTTGTSYSSIMGIGNNLSWGTAGSVSNDDITAPNVNLTTIPGGAFTFTYQGETVTGFNMCSNGWMKLNSASSAATTSTSFSNNISNAVLNVLAPFWDDLSTNPNSGFAAGDLARLQNSMKYAVIGSTPGSRQLVVEWNNMTVFGAGGPQLSFQVVLDETDNSITYNYGLFQGFNGTNNHRYTYTTGLNGRFVSAIPFVGQVVTQQYENTAAFSNNNALVTSIGANGLLSIPECNSTIKFTPGVYAGFTPPTPTAPVNDEAVNAITVPSQTTFPANLCGNFYTSRFATPSAQTVCSGNADDDVWFKFVANEPAITVRVYGSGGYVPAVQVLNNSLDTLSPAKCVIGTAGGTQVDVTLTGLTVDSTYYVRVYHNGGGVTATATANISGGSVTSFTITNGGSGYTTTGTGSFTTGRITLTGGGGVNAVASYTQTAGVVTTVTVQNGGTGYTTAPTVTIESPSAAHIGEFALVVYAPAVNDDCAGAIALTNLSNTGCVNGQNAVIGKNTGSATASVQATCAGTADDDVWYQFTATAAQTEINLTGFSAFDGVLEVFDAGVAGSCSSMVSIACANVTGVAGTELVVLNDTIGHVYFVRVYHAGAGSGALSNYDLCIRNVTAPANDSCSNAIEIIPFAGNCGTPVSGSNFGGTPSDSTLTGCSGNADDDVWYKFTANDTLMQITLVSSINHDGVFELFDGGACPDSIGDRILCVDVPAQGGTETSLIGGLTSGNVYYLRVYEFNTAWGSGDFTLCVNAPDVIAPVISNLVVTPAGSACIPTSRTVTVDVTDNNAVDTVFITWTVEGVAQPGIPMVPGVGNSYSATIPAQGSNSVAFIVNAQDFAAPTPNVATTTVTTYRDNYLSALSFSAGADQIKNTGASATLISSYNKPASCLKITEITLFKGGTGATSPYPSYAVGDDIVEITNTGNSALSLDGVHIKAEGLRTVDFTFPNSVTVPANGIVIVNFGTGTNDLVNRAFFTATDGGDVWSSGTANGVYLTNASGTIIDAVATNGYVFSGPSGVTAADWTGSAVGLGGNAGTRLTGADLNNGTNWVTASTSAQNVGTINSGIPGCVPPAPYTVTWTGGNLVGSVVGDTVVTPVYIAPPASYTYVATLDDGTCTVSDTVVVTTQLPVTPVANFGVNTTSHTIGSPTSTAVFADSSTNTPDTWAWTFSPATVNYVNGTSATSQNPQVQFTAPGLYTVTLIASNGGGSDDTTRTNYITVTLSYCASNATSSADTKIDSVFFGTIVSGTDTLACEQYTDNTALSTTIQQGVPVPFTMINGSCSGDFFDAIGKVFIDLNQNGLFTDAGEEFATFTPLDLRETMVANITIPITSNLGSTRLRLVYRETTVPSAVTPCGTYGFGETEDFTINITPAPLCSGTPDAGTLADTIVNCFGDSSLITSTGFTNDQLGITFQWIESNDDGLGDPYAPVTTGSGQTTSSLQTAPLTSSIYYRLIATCSASTLSDTSNAIFVEVLNPQVTSVTPDTRCGLGLVDLSAVGSGDSLYWYNDATSGSILFQGGTYQTFLTATDTFYVEAFERGCTSAPRVAVTATLTNAPAFAVSNSNYAPQCAGVPVTLSVTTGAGDYDTYLWSPSAGLSDTTGASVTATPSATTVYTVLASSSTGLFCQSVDTVIVNIYGRPVINSITVSDSTLCAGTSANITASVSPFINPGFGGSFIRTATSGLTYSTLAGGGITVINTNAQLTAGFSSVTQDDGGVLVTLPFSFAYNGTSSNQISFSTNGWISVGSTYSTITAGPDRAPANLFSSTAPNSTIAAWFRDMGANFPAGTGSMRHGLIATDVYAFQWDKAVGSGFSDGSAILTSFQINIYGPASSTPGKIDYIYGPTVGTISTGASIGLESAVGGSGNFINALNGSSTSTATATAWPGNGNGYSFVPVPPSVTSYSWTNGATLSNDTIANPIATPTADTTTYVLTVSESGTGCTSTGSVTVYTQQFPQPQVTPGNGTICTSPDYWVHLIDLGAYSGGYPSGTLVNWLGIQNGLSPNDSINATLGGTNFIAEVTTPFGCTDTSDTVTINVDVINVNRVTTDATCGNPTGQIVATVSNPFGVGPYRYVWTDGVITLRDVTSANNTDSLENLVAGTYFLTVYDNEGGVVPSLPSCNSGSLSTTVNNANGPDAEIVSSVNITCFGLTNGEATADATGGVQPYSFLWSTTETTPGIINLGAGLYVVTVTDANGCTDTAQVTIVEPSAIEISVNVTNVAVCGDSTGSATAIATGGTPGYLYEYYDENLTSLGAPSTNPTFTGLYADTFFVQVTDTNNCTNFIQFAVTEVCDVTVNLKVYFEGYASSFGSPFLPMSPGLFFQGVSANDAIADTVQVDLRDPFSSATVIETAYALIDTGGNATLTFSSAVNGGTYWLSVMHRSSVETFSASPITLSGSNSYNFTTSDTMSYGPNMKDVFTDGTTWAMYSGDIFSLDTFTEGQDGFIDIFDLLLLDFDLQSGVSGYYRTDLNGDGFVDIFDLLILDPNIQAGISKITPP